ncbi:MAG: patatin-like phospholipase family protein [Kiritimatiellia bacterium]|jgi:NTE family protein|nr:patatin-like phospholipase family protein [Kiritimatiellia bacterium]
MHPQWKNKRVGLALGSGGARGWAHLGVLEVLKEKGVAVDRVAGVSMGAAVGAFFAAGRSPVLRDLAVNLDWNRLRQFFWEISLSRSGLTDGKRLLEETANLLGASAFEELGLPMRAVATDLATGGEVVLAAGDLLQALRASISIPGLFSPVRLDGRLLVDAGWSIRCPSMWCATWARRWSLPWMCRRAMSRRKNLRGMSATRR